MWQGTAQTLTCRLRPGTTSATVGQLYPADTRVRGYFSASLMSASEMSQPSAPRAQAVGIERRRQQRRAVER